MSGFAEYERYDALGLADLVRRKEVSPEDLLDAAIGRVEARNQAVNAVVMPLYDYGRKAIADGLPDGPFHGVPFLLKDLGGWLAGVKVTRGPGFFADAPAAAADSEHVRRLKRAGLVIFGRTNSWASRDQRRPPRALLPGLRSATSCRSAPCRIGNKTATASPDQP